MVKADVTRDYYADLDVPSNASEEEIKRAFRNLGVFFRPKLVPHRLIHVLQQNCTIQTEILAEKLMSFPNFRRCRLLMRS